MTDAAHADAPFVLALAFDADVRAKLTALRREHFPAERNHLDAHVTVFHALPVAKEEVWGEDLAAAAARTAPFAIRFEAPYSLGRGVAIRVVAPELVAWRERLRLRWSAFLTRQDAQAGYRPHCTVQNKVEPAAALKLLDELDRSWTPLTATATAIEVWRYVGGPWRFERIARLDA